MSAHSRGYVLGVDGGNTKSLAAIADLQGTVVGVGRGGCSDIYGAGSTEQAIKEIERAVGSASRAIGLQGQAFVSSTFSLAGADWPEDIEFLESAVEALGGRRTVVVNDAMGALRAGSIDGTGVAVVCGTGAAIGARGRDGRSWHSGWWQKPQGSRHLAQQAMDAVYQAELGIDSATTLTPRVLRLYGEQTVEAVLHRNTAREGRHTVSHAALTSILLDESERGDSAALRIVRGHGCSLGDYIVAAAMRIELDDSAFQLVLAGGVFRHAGTILRDAIVDRVRVTYPEVRPVLVLDEPVVGAVLLALEAAGIEVDATVQARLRAGMQCQRLVSLVQRVNAGRHPT